MLRQDNTESPQEDAVWKLLSEAKPMETSPAFTQNVLRAVRQSGTQESTTWWNKLLSPKVALPACAALALALIIGLQSPETAKNTVQGPTQPSNLEVEAESWYDDALLSTAVENPELFSDEELVAMIF